MASTNTVSLARAEDEIFRLFISNVSDYAIYMLSPEGNVRTWNAGAQRFKGYTAEEITGQHFSRFYTEEDIARGVPARALKTALEEGKFEAEGWRVRKDGRRFWAQVVIDPVFDEQGKHVGFAKITRDITERRAAALEKEQLHQQALDAKTAEFENLVRLFAQSPGFICFFRGPQHVYELQNEAHARLAQYRDIIGKPVREALPELDGQGFFELLDGVYRSGQPFVGLAQPLSVEKSPGQPAEIRYIDFVYQPIFDDEQRVIGIFAQGSDVTDRVRAEQEVRQNQLELERLVAQRTEALEKAHEALEQGKRLQGDKTHLLRLFEQTPGFMCFLNGERHVFELANQAYYKLVGHRDLIGLPIREALPELDGQVYFELLDKVYASGEPFIGQGMPVTIEEARGAAPQTRYLDFIYQPIHGTDGKVLGIFVQGSDVTETRRAQEELKRYQAELESRVEERTRALEAANSALHRAQKLESIGKLTGGVAHDFNNILQVIGGNLQLLAPHVRNNELATKRLETAIHAVDRGGKLSSQLLAFARRQPLQPEVTAPGRIARGMDEILRRALGETIQLETIVAGGTWNMLVDPHQLENVILNLAINSRDAMPDGGKLTIEVSNSMLDDDYVASHGDMSSGQYVMLAVSDTGTGMAPDVLERACEPFFTTKKEGEGTGLGLSMVYGFVKQSGGHIKIYSEEGYGTTVKMYFPRSLEAETVVAPYSSSPVIGGNETILVVEDDAAVQATVVDMLKGLGYKVLKADDAESALVVLKSGFAIDMLFTDVVMPGRIRAPELARQAMLLVPGIEVLFTSGYTQNAIVHGGRLDPGVQLISKPYRREQLARKIRHMFANRQQIALVKEMARRTEDASVRQPGLRVLVVEDNADALQIVCEMLSMLGCEAVGTRSAEEALSRLDEARTDVLFTDFSLPRMNGLELARRAKQTHPQMGVIFASGYTDVIENPDEMGAVVLSKPYDLRKVQDALNRFESLT